MSTDVTRASGLRKSALWLLVLLPIPLVLSCAGASLVNEWRDPSYSDFPMTHLLIVAMSHDPSTRRLWEDGFVFELEKRGVTAEPSYRLFPDAAPDTERLIAAVRQDGFDGVLLTHRLATQVERHYVPGIQTVEPYTVFNRWGHYETFYREVDHHGTTETDRVVRHQTDLWSTSGGDRMVWSAIGEVIDPGSGEAIHREIAKRVVPELAQERLIPNGRSSEHLSWLSPWRGFPSAAAGARPQLSKFTHRRLV